MSVKFGKMADISPSKIKRAKEALEVLSSLVVGEEGSGDGGSSSFSGNCSSSGINPPVIVKSEPNKSKSRYIII